jgi:hypothetical protein
MPPAGRTEVNAFKIWKQKYNFIFFKAILGVVGIDLAKTFNVFINKDVVLAKLDLGQLF